MRNFLRLISAVGDYILLLLALVIVIYTRTNKILFIYTLREYLSIFLWLFIVWLAMFYLFDLYNFEVPPRFTRFFFCLILCVLSTSLIFYAFPNITTISPKTNLVLLGVLFALFFYIWRQIIELLFVKIFHGHEIMMAISDMDSLELANSLYTNPRYKYHLNGVLVISELLEKARELFPSTILFEDSIKFEESIIKSKVQTLVSTSLWFSRLYGTMYELMPRKVRIINMINFHEKTLGYIPVHSTSQHWIMTNVDIVERRIYMAAKYFLDYIFALALLPFVLIAMIFIILALKIFGEKKSNPFFSQRRVGFNNKEFTLIKFRTMFSDAEKDGAKWATEKDPRVTSIGRVLRLTRLDELPQIFNILKGDMSFIGPRPERKHFVDTLAKEIPHYHLRHLIKPGLSGWAQVKFRYGNSVEDSSVKLCYDLYYIKNMNFALDFRILVRTIIKIITAKGQ